MKKISLAITATILTALAYTASLHYVEAASRPAQVTVPGSSVVVIDGDTIRWKGQKIRLLGFDTPEIYPGHYKCEKERLAGLKARDALVGLLAPKNKPTIAFNASNDLYGRRVARLYSNGKDVSAIMISTGLGVAYRGGQRTGWCK